MRTGRTTLLLLLSWIGPGPPAAAADAVVEIEARGDAFPEGQPSRQGWLRIAPRLTAQIASRVLLTVAPVLEADTLGDVGRRRLYDDDDRGLRRTPLRFERLSLRFDLGAVRVELGKQPLAWGRTDAVRPTDNLTPRDWTDPLHEVRLSPWAVRVNAERKRWEGELALVPRYTPSRLPRLDGRWAPVEPIRVTNPAFPAAGPAELRLALELAEPEFPATTVDDLQTGLRFGRRGVRAEWALSYYRGFDDAPHFEPSAGAPDPSTGTLPVTLTPRFPRLEVVGADGVLVAGPWALRAEAGLFRFPAGGDDGFLLYEVDAEWTRGAWRVVAGFADDPGRARATGAATPGGTPGDAAAGTVSLDLALLPAVFFHFGRSLPTEWEASLEATVGTRDGDGLVRLSGSWPATDGLRLGAELDLVDGRRGSFYGAWRRNDRLRLYARITF